ncbi:conserved hypothetical protein [Frankia sp. Hr75.2]|nr:hypothetical protein E0504_42580 [Parafrankia sp. BMG5.11]CAI7980921.1 conserved hypothetical protein [Frankia sp. Hr75.2]SQD97249.1 conserved hypothetical protein [Parafrankia sp. Ea1.12]
MGENGDVTTPCQAVALPAELAHALDATAEAREQWALQSDETRQLYASWVGTAATHRSRRRRAERTANYAATGVLHRSVQRQRDRSIAREMISALWFSLVGSTLAGVVILLVDGRVNWYSVSMPALTILGTAVQRTWRNRRAPVAPTMGSLTRP